MRPTRKTRNKPVPRGLAGASAHAQDELDLLWLGDNLMPPGEREQEDTRGCGGSGRCAAPHCTPATPRAE